MSAWEVVYENQMTLWNFYSGGLGQSQLAGFIRSQIENGRPEERYAAIPLDNGGLGRAVVQGLWQADPVYISPEMGELHRAAFPGFNVEPLLPQDLITPSGFVMFPEPLYLTDINWKRMSWRALAWWPCLATSTKQSQWHYDGETMPDGKPGIFIAMFSHIDDDDDFHSELRPLYADLSQKFGTMPKLGLLHYTPWIFGEGGPQSERGKELFQQVQVFFRLTQQTITTQEQIGLSRAARRRAQKAKQPEKTITVIRLRRPRHKSEGEGEGRKLSYRHIRHGHWRNQYFPSTKTHRQIFIHDMIVGSEDLPLRISERRAFELVQ